MTGDRERRARLEAAQARLARARAASAAPPDVEAEVAPLRDEAARLEAEGAELQARLEASARDLSSAEGGLAEARRARLIARSRTRDTRTIGVLVTLGGAAVGGVVGAVGLYLGVVLAGEVTLGPLAAGAVVSALGGVAAAVAAYRLGKAS